MDGISPSKMGTVYGSDRIFQELVYVEPGPLNMNSMDASFRGMYQKWFQEAVYGNLTMVAAGLEALNSDKWIKENINSWDP